jgi:hypothetical protein
MNEETRSPHPNALPNFQRAIIPRQKLVNYLLDPLHKEGQHKARVFRAALDFEQSSWEELAQAMLAELPYYPATLGSEGRWGKKYEVTLPITGRNDRTVNILTIWIIRLETNFPTFVTALVVGERE